MTAVFRRVFAQRQSSSTSSSFHSISAGHRIRIWDKISSLKGVEEAEVGSQDCSITLCLASDPSITLSGDKKSLTPLDLLKILPRKPKGDCLFAAVKTQSSSDLHLLDLAAAPINVPVTPSSSTINISFLTGSDEDFNVNSSIQLQDAIWHSSAHILGWALETKYGDSILLDNGPAISDGFFYDGLLTTAGSEFVSKTLDRLDNTSDGTSWLDRLIEESYTSSSASSIYHNGSNIKSANIISNILKSYATSASSLLFHYTAAASAATNLQPSPSIFSAKEEDLTHLESIMKTLVAKRAKFERMVVPLNVAVAMFASNPFKLKYLYRLASLQQQQQQQRQQFITVYRCGDFIDLCRGPHLPHTGFVKAFKLTQTSSSQWTTLPTPSSSLSPASSASSLPSSPSNALTRITGTSFLSSAALATHLHSKATAQARDHRAIGTKQSLFFFHPYSPGSPFLLPHGTRIMNALVGMLRGEYRRRGFDEVVTPLLFDKRLWQVSGHWENYRDDMFSIGMGKGSSINGGTLGETGFSSSITSPGGLEGSCSHSHTNHSEEIHSHKGNTTENGDEEQVYGLKPMNCPGHCLMYASSTRSYKDLPIRYAEFSPLHRNEATGALTGLTRVRKFHQDDAHIFCTFDHLATEIKSTLSLIHDIYSKWFGFGSYTLALSTRPEQFIGGIEEWDMAEKVLGDVVESFVKEKASTMTSMKELPPPCKVSSTIKHGDGAFYGPKIDIMVMDAAGRRHQVGTVQLDLQLPKRFGLEYVGANGSPKPLPVMVHRAVLGSVERMMAVLAEHYAVIDDQQQPKLPQLKSGCKIEAVGAKWPFWLSPRQAMVIVVDATCSRQIEYAQAVACRLNGRWQGGGEEDSLSSKSRRNNYFYVDVDSDKNSTLNKRIRDALLAQYNYILVVGDSEVDQVRVSLRKNVGKGGGGNKSMTLEEVIDLFVSEIPQGA